MAFPSLPSSRRVEPIALPQSAGSVRDRAATLEWSVDRSETERLPTVLLRRGFGLLLSASHDGLAGANRRLDIAQVELTEQVHGGSQHVVSEALE